MITVENLSKNYSILMKGSGLRGALRSLFGRTQVKIVPAVKNISFTIQPGELVGFLGPNGAGKTTTLKILSGLLYPTSGSVQVLGHVPYHRNQEFLRNFSMVMGQRTQLWWDLPARETYRLNQRIYEIPDSEFSAWQAELIDLLELERVVDVPVKKLSLGQRMKAEMAAALLHKPKVLLLDEPTLGLDLLMQKKFRQFILDYNARFNATVLLTSHNMDDVEELARRVLIIDNGELLYNGLLTDIVKHLTPAKQIRFTSAVAIDAEKLSQFGTVLQKEERSATLEIPRDFIAAAISGILKNFNVIDLNIEELPIEEIIRKVFQKDSALHLARLSSKQETDPDIAADLLSHDRSAS